MPENNEKKQFIVDVQWIRPNKICAIFDLILAIICYIICLFSNSWVIERYEYEDSNTEYDYTKYWVGLSQQCYLVSRAKELLDIACKGSSKSAFSSIINQRGDGPNEVGSSCGNIYRQLQDEFKKNHGATNCIGVEQSLPWAHGMTMETMHFTVTYWCIFAFLAISLACCAVAIVIYCKNNKKVNLTHFYKIIGIVLGVVFVLNLVVVVYFGWKFPDNAPYSSEDWYMWTGYGFCFAASILVLIAAILFFFGAQWKTSGSHHRRTMNY